MATEFTSSDGSYSEKPSVPSQDSKKFGNYGNSPKPAKSSSQTINQPKMSGKGR